MNEYASNLKWLSMLWNPIHLQVYTPYLMAAYPNQELVASSYKVLQKDSESAMITLSSQVEQT